MKKKTKIALSVLGVFLVLLTVASVFLASQGFFRYARSPEIEFIDFSDTNPISVKDLERAYREKEEEYKNEENSFEDAYLSLDDTGIEYTYEVTFKNHTIEEYSSLEKMSNLLDGMHNMFISAYVSYNEYLKAKEEGQDTVPVHIEAEIYKADFDPAAVDTYEGITTKKYIDAVVEEIEPVFDTELRVSGSEYEFEKKEFRVKYADGTEKTLSPVKLKETDIMPGYDYNRYSLDGSYMVLDEVYGDKDHVLTLKYLDSEIKFNVESIYEKDVKAIEKIEITGYEYDVNYDHELSEISYTVTNYEGKTIGLTSARKENGAFVSGYAFGYPVYVNVKKNYNPSEITISLNCLTATTAEHIEPEEEITLLDTIDFEYVGAIFFAFLQGLPEILS